MAKTPSLKQQLIQELANQTVAQLQPQNNDVAQLQAQYDSWVQEQEVASLQAQYDEWLKAQTPQEVPQAAPQVQAPQVQAPQVQAPQVQAPIAEKPSAPKRSLRLEQEEAKMLAKEAQQRQNVLNDVNALRQNRLSDFAKMGLGEGIMKSPASSVDQLPSIADYQSQIQQASEKEREAKEIEDRIANLDNYVQPVTNQTDSLKETAQNVELANKWLDPNYQFTKDEGQKAYDVAIKELQKLDGIRPADMTDEEKARYDAFKDLEVKSNRLNAFAVGAADEALKMAKGINSIQKYVPGANTLYNIPYLGQKMQEGIDKGLDNLRDSEAVELAKGAAPLADNVPVIGQITPFGTGKMATQMAAYMLTNPAFDAAGAAIGGGSKAAAFLGNQLGQNVQDVALDTIPTYEELMKDGSLSDEDKKELLSNIGLNAAGNLVMGGIGEIPGIAKSIGDKMPKDVADNSAFFKRAMGEEVIDTGDEVVDNAIRQQKAATEEIERLAKQIPEVPESEVKNLVEDAIPEKPVEEAVEDVAKQAPEAPKAEAPTAKPEIEEIDGVRQYVKNPNISSEANQRINSDLYMLEEMANDIPLKEQLGKLSEENQKLMMDYLDYGSQLRRGVYPENAKAKMAEIAEQIKSADKADKAIMKDIKDWDDILNSIENYKAALNGDDRKAVEDAAKALDAARNRLARRKATDPRIKSTFGKQFGPVINRPKSLYAAPGENLDVSEIDNIAENVAKQTPETVEGADPMQYFAEGKPEGDWKTSRLKTNTLENQGWGDELPNKDYAYRVWHTAEQHKTAKERGQSFEDLLLKDRYDAADVKAVMSEIHSKMESKDVRKANRLAQQLFFEEKANAQAMQALAEYNHNTIEGALADAAKVQDDILTPWKTQNTKTHDGNSRIARALADMGHKADPTVKTKLTHDQIKKGIVAELEREFGSIDKYFNEEDIEFLANLAEDKSIPLWQITDEIEHKLKHGTWYPIEKEVHEKFVGNSRLASILKSIGDDTKPETKAPLSHAEIKEGITNELKREFANMEAQFNDNDIEFLTRLVEDKSIKNWQIADEISYKLEHGDWYSLDESLPEKTVKNKQVSQMLNNILNGKNNAKPAKEMTIGELLTGIKNSLNDEPLSVSKQFTDDDYYFIAQMMQNDVPKWQIEDELAHRIQHGEWYTLDESTKVAKPTNRKLQQALDSLVNEEIRAEKTAPSLKQIREEVRNTLEKELAGSEFSKFTDDDIDYLANLIHEGATSEEIARALDMRAATGSWGISDETLQDVNNIFKRISQFDENSKEFVEGQAEAYRRLAEELVPNATPLEKLDAWRYLAMLGNPKTMMRNLIGNTAFGGVTGFSNTIAAIAESGVDKTVKAFGGEGIQRTKSVLNPFKDSDLIKASAIDADASRYRQIAGSKYEKMDKDALRQSRSVFNSKLLQLYEKATDAGISDYHAVKAKYATSLAGYLKANGMDKSIFDTEIELNRLKKLSEERLLTDAEKASMENLKQEVKRLDKARDYALKQAEYATFHEDNAIAKFLTETSRNARNSKNGAVRAMGYMLEGIVPFKKTPANVLRSGIEYSPLGAIDSIRRTGKLIYENTGKRAGNLADVYTNKHGKEISKELAADVIDSWSKTLTGTGMAALGFYLYDKGILHSSDPETKYQDQLEGHQNYAIEINGKSYTIDWAAPAVMSLMVGAELAKIWDSTGKGREDFFNNINDYVEVANRISDPLIETSMLQGVRDTAETAANYAKNDEAINILPLLAYNTLTGYASQAVPTIGGQIARTIDPYRRSTYTDKEGMAGVFDKQLKKQMNKIPGLSMLNEKYVDTYGRTQKNSPSSNPAVNLAYQMLSPGYMSDIRETDADKVSREAFKVSENENVLPKWKSSFKIDGKRVSPKQYTRASEIYGRTQADIRAKLYNDLTFRSLSPEDKEEIMKKVNTLSEKAAMESIDPNFKTSNDYTTYKEQGISALVEKYKEDKDYSEAMDKYGLTKSTTKKQIFEDEGEEGLKTLADFQEYGNNNATYAYKRYEKAKEQIPGLTVKEYKETVNKIDGLYDNKKNGQISQDEMLAYLNSGNFSQQEAEALWSQYGNDWKGKIKQKKDGTWYIPKK